MEDIRNDAKKTQLEHYPKVVEAISTGPLSLKKTIMILLSFCCWIRWTNQQIKISTNWKLSVYVIWQAYSRVNIIDILESISHKPNIYRTTNGNYNKSNFDKYLSKNSKLDKVVIIHNKSYKLESIHYKTNIEGYLMWK